MTEQAPPNLPDSDFATQSEAHSPKVDVYDYWHPDKDQTKEAEREAETISYAESEVNPGILSAAVRTAIGFSSTSVPSIMHQSGLAEATAVNVFDWMRAKGVVAKEWTHDKGYEVLIHDPKLLFHPENEDTVGKTNDGTLSTQDGQEATAQDFEVPGAVTDERSVVAPKEVNPDEDTVESGVRAMELEAQRREELVIHEAVLRADPTLKLKDPKDPNSGRLGKRAYEKRVRSELTRHMVQWQPTPPTSAELARRWAPDPDQVIKRDDRADHKVTEDVPWGSGSQMPTIAGRPINLTDLTYGKPDIQDVRNLREQPSVQDNDLIVDKVGVRTAGLLAQARHATPKPYGHDEILDELFPYKEQHELSEEEAELLEFSRLEREGIAPLQTSQELAGEADDSEN